MEAEGDVSKAAQKISIDARFAAFNFRGLLIPLSLLAVWAIAGRRIGSESLSFASAGSVIKVARELIANGSLWVNYTASVDRIVKGFAIGATLGVAVGSILGTSRLANRLFSPLIIAMRQIPIFGLIPLLALWLGMGETSKLTLIALAGFYPIALNTHEGLRNVPLGFREVAALYRFNRVQTLRRILLPCALPSIITGFKQALSFAWIAGIGAELFLATAPGMGNLLETGRDQFRMDIVLLAIILISVTGTVMNQTITLVERSLLRWRPTFSDNI